MRECDVPDCPWEKDVHTWVITGPSSTHHVHLCTAHARSLEVIAGLGRTVGTPRGRTEADVMDELWDDTKDET